MAQVLVATRNMPRDEWLAWRRKGIGGSDAAAIAGLSRWRSPVAVWLEKTGQIESEEPGEAAYWGTVLEEIIAKEFSARTGKKVKRRLAILQHPDYPFMLANVDRLVVGEKAGLECKTTGEYRKAEWEDDRIPDEYVLQCQHYMVVTGYPRWYIAVLIGGNKFRWKVIERDEEIINYLIKIESDFWRLVENRTPPEMDGSEASKKALQLLYPESQPDTLIELPPTAAELFEQYDKAIKLEEQARELKEMAENKIKALLGEKEVGICGDRRVTWKTVISNRLDSKALKKAHPDIYSQFCKESITRRFQVK